MKTSSALLSISLVLLILPYIWIRQSLSYQIKHNLYRLHSTKSILNGVGINEIHLKNVENFIYEYNSDSASLEMVSKSRNDTLQVKRDNSIIYFTAVKVRDSLLAKKSTYIYSGLNLLTNENNKSLQPPLYDDRFNMVNQSIVKYKGPQLPKLIAENSLIYIDSISRNSSFEFDLDFSVVYWHNYDHSHKFVNKNNTYRWQMKSMKISLENGSYYFNKDLIFDTLDLVATKNTDLHLESYEYNNVKLIIDSTVRVNAPYRIWKNLKIIEKK